MQRMLSPQGNKTSGHDVVPVNGKIKSENLEHMSNTHKVNSISQISHVSTIACAGQRRCLLLPINIISLG
jgi:hypothetical protein